MRYLKSKKFQTYLLVGLLFFTLNMILIYFVGIPQLRSIGDEARENEEKLLVIEMMVANEKRIQETEDSNDDLRDELISFEDKVPDYIDTPQTVYDFYTYTTDKKMTPIRLAFSEPIFPVKKDEEALTEEESETKVKLPENNSLLTLYLNFVTQGEVTLMESFLRDLSKISKLEMSIESLQITMMEGNQFMAEISFIQYIQGVGLRDKSYENYDFAVERDGFERIADLFNQIPSSTLDPSVDEIPLDGDNPENLSEEEVPAETEVEIP